MDVKFMNDLAQKIQALDSCPSDEQLLRLVQLVAEECAKLADQHSASDRRLDRLGEGSRVAGWEIAAAIRAKFGVKA